MFTINAGGQSWDSFSDECTFRVNTDGSGTLTATLVPGRVAFPPVELFFVIVNDDEMLAIRRDDQHEAGGQREDRVVARAAPRRCARSSYQSLKVAASSDQMSRMHSTFYDLSPQSTGEDAGLNLRVRPERTPDPRLRKRGRAALRPPGWAGVGSHRLDSPTGDLADMDLGAAWCRHGCAEMKWGYEDDVCCRTPPLGRHSRSRSPMPHARMRT